MVFCRGSDRELNGKRAPDKKFILQDKWIILPYIMYIFLFNVNLALAGLYFENRIIYQSIIELSWRINFSCRARFPLSSRSDTRQFLRSTLSVEFSVRSTANCFMFNRRYLQWLIFNSLIDNVVHLIWLIEAMLVQAIVVRVNF